jgi:DNA replicative helicase MCM subunit Mcm2 (Cdc46/Mcm family)
MHRVALLIGCICSWRGKKFNYKDKFFCSFGNKHVTPRTLTSRYLGNMVCVEGIVTKSKINLPIFAVFFTNCIIESADDGFLLMRYFT